MLLDLRPLSLLGAGAHRQLPVQLRRLLSYDAVYGELYFQRVPEEYCSSPAEYERHKKRSGEVARTQRENGSFVRILGVEYMAPRVAWFLAHDVDPGGDVIVMRNGDMHDLRLKNLARVNRTTAARLQALGSGNTGIVKRGLRWEARIRGDDGQIYLGAHETPEAAQEARIQGMIEHWGAEVKRGKIILPLI